MNNTESEINGPVPSGTQITGMPSADGGPSSPSAVVRSARNSLRNNRNPFLKNTDDETHSISSFWNASSDPLQRSATPVTPATRDNIDFTKPEIQTTINDTVNKFLKTLTTPPQPSISQGKGKSSLTKSQKRSLDGLTKLGLTLEDLPFSFQLTKLPHESSKQFKSRRIQEGIRLEKFLAAYGNDPGSAKVQFAVDNQDSSDEDTNTPLSLNNGMDIDSNTTSPGDPSLKRACSPENLSTLKRNKADPPTTPLSPPADTSQPTDTAMASSTLHPSDSSPELTELEELRSRLAQLENQLSAEKQRSKGLQRRLTELESSSHLQQLESVLLTKVQAIVKETLTGLFPGTAPRNRPPLAHESKQNPTEQQISKSRRQKTLQNPSPPNIPTSSLSAPLPADTISSHLSLITELKGDLFSAPADVPLAHCVAADLQMGAGIAVEFKNRFGGVAELKAQNCSVGQVAHIVSNGRPVLYIITKSRSDDKPQFADFKRALTSLRHKCEELGITRLAIPKIGCGLDRLNWSTQVRPALLSEFQNSGIELMVFSLPPKASTLPTSTPWNQVVKRSTLGTQKHKQPTAQQKPKQVKKPGSTTIANSVLLLPSAPDKSVQAALGTFPELRPSKFGVSRTVPFPSGALLVKCKDAEGAAQLKQIITHSGAARIKEPQTFTPTIRLFDVPADCTVENLQEELREQLSCESAEIKFSPTRDDRKTAYVKVDHNTFSSIQLQGRKSIRIGWLRCAISTAATVPRCANCQLLGHGNIKCQNEPRQPPNKGDPCLDCTKHNEGILRARLPRYRLRNTTHSTGDSSCPTKAHLLRKRSSHSPPPSPSTGMPPTPSTRESPLTPSIGGVDYLMEHA